MKATIHTGGALNVLKTLPSESVQCVVTSPPYYGLRDYGEDEQLGLEDTPEAYVERLVGIMEEVRRVLRSDGVCWLNLGDSYAGSGKSSGQEKWLGGNKQRTNKGSLVTQPTRATGNLKSKDLIGIPWMVAFALRDAGWWLRQDIIWKKNNVMPESVTDRCTNQHEYIFLLSKSARYFYDHEAVKEDSEPAQAAHNARYAKEYTAHSERAPATGQPGNVNNVGIHSRPGSGGKRNRRSVWEVNTTPFPGAHFATFPVALIEPCIMAGTSAKGCCSECGTPWERVTERTAMKIKRSGRGEALGEYGRTSASGTMLEPARSETIGWQPGCTCNADVVPCTVLDPFSGSGTTGMVALAKGCNYIGIELSAEYAEMSRRRIKGDAPLFNNVHVAA